jgi:LAS superfamily LD-carboxypeptidase LdcB
LGINDAADPTTHSLLGDTPGLVGINDHAAAHSSAGDRTSLLVTTSGTPVASTAPQTSADAFKAKVLAAQIARGKAHHREQFAAIPDSDLEVVEGHYKMRKAAAAKCRELLTSLRTELAQAQERLAKKSADELAQAKAAAKARHEVLESEVKGVWVASGYRSYEKDEGLWNSYYPRYYKETAKARAKLPGGEHGDAAAKYLAKYIGKYKAAPGFSNHSNGMAVDLWTQEGTEKITADKSLQVRWKRTWVHKWLVKNAATFGFKPYENEAWHWEYSE